MSRGFSGDLKTPDQNWPTVITHKTATSSYTSHFEFNWMPLGLKQRRIFRR